MGTLFPPHYTPEGSIVTGVCHFHLTRKCLFGIRGKSTTGVNLLLGESDCLDWSSDKDNTLVLAEGPCYMT